MWELFRALQELIRFNECSPQGNNMIWHYCIYMALLYISLILNYLLHSHGGTISFC